MFHHEASHALTNKDVKRTETVNSAEVIFTAKNQDDILRHQVQKS